MLLSGGSKAKRLMRSPPLLTKSPRPTVAGPEFYLRRCSTLERLRFLSSGIAECKPEVNSVGEIDQVFACEYSCDARSQLLLSQPD